MGKKSSWFSFVKRLFIPEAKSEEEKRWRWVFGRLRLKKYPTLAAPQRTLIEATEEQRKHAVAVAIATAAAAEAAVAAAHAAAEVVRLTTNPHEFGKRNRNLAAVKIQSVFRGHLARKALKALKGVVRLQAVVRGQITRGRVMKKLNYFPSIAKADLQVHQMRVPCADESSKDGAKIQLLGTKRELEEKQSKILCRSDKSWDCSLFSKEDIEAFCLRKQEAISKRERMKQYSFSHRERRNDQPLEGSSGRQSLRFEQLLEMEAHRRRETEKLKSIINSNTIPNDAHGTKQSLLRNAHNDPIEELNLTVSLPRRSFCSSKQKSIGDESSLPNSPVFPTYMTATESARAKARSMSTPKQRLGFSDTYSGENSPYKLRLSSWTSFNGEMTSTNGKTTAISQQMLSNIKGPYRD